MSLKFLKVVVQERIPGHLFSPAAATKENKQWEKDFGVADITVTYEIDCVKWVAHGSGDAALALVPEEAWKSHLNNLVAAIRSKIEGIRG